MGGQACVFYGAAQVSKDIDFLILAEEENFNRLLKAMEMLQANRIAVPPFQSEALARGHAVHFRCRAPGVEGLRIDIMTRLRSLDSFEGLWERHTVFVDDQGMEFHLLSVPDLVEAKKTQRSRDWPMIESLVAIHCSENISAPKEEWITFWLMETLSPEALVDLCIRFPSQAATLEQARPLLALARGADFPGLRGALAEEILREQEKDRIYWEPLKREMEEFRRAERAAAGGGGDAE